MVLGERLDDRFDAGDRFDRRELGVDERFGQLDRVGVDGVPLAEVRERLAIRVVGELAEVMEKRSS